MPRQRPENYSWSFSDFAKRQVGRERGMNAIVTVLPEISLFLLAELTGSYRILSADEPFPQRIQRSNDLPVEM